MRPKPTVALLALAGLLLAVSIGLGAYFASRDSVGLPVTKLDQAPRDLAPTVPRKRASARASTTRTTTTLTERHGGSTQTTEDHSGRGSNSGHGGGGGDD